LGSWFRVPWKAAATTAKGCAKRTVATRQLAGLRAKPPGIAAGSGLVLYFAGPSLCMCGGARRGLTLPGRDA
jgi:hypothetical protein